MICRMLQSNRYNDSLRNGHNDSTWQHRPVAQWCCRTVQTHPWSTRQPLVDEPVPWSPASQWYSGLPVDDPECLECQLPSHTTNHHISSLHSFTTFTPQICNFNHKPQPVVLQVHKPPKHQTSVAVLRFCYCHTVYRLGLEPKSTQLRDGSDVCSPYLYVLYISTLHILDSFMALVMRCTLHNSDSKNIFTGI